MVEDTKTEEMELDITEPVIINLGKRKRKGIKNLLKGRGKLLHEVEDVIEEVSSMLGEELDGKVIVPLILVYKEKPKRRKRGIFS